MLEQISTREQAEHRLQMDVDCLIAMADGSTLDQMLRVVSSLIAASRIQDTGREGRQGHQLALPAQDYLEHVKPYTDEWQALSWLQLTSEGRSEEEISVRLGLTRREAERCIAYAHILNRLYVRNPQAFQGWLLSAGG